MQPNTTRLAPSPTGAMHLGNARTFVINWLLARQQDWQVRMRIEDLDSPRVKAGSSEQLLDELAWLGLTWTGEVVRQSARQHAYQAALDGLIASGSAYPCTCSRRDIELAGGAPHADDRIDTYPGTCRGRFTDAQQATQTSKPVAWRVRVEDRSIEFKDAVNGTADFNLARNGGDFVIFRNAGQAAYQLAVVVDDHQCRIDRIVRGDDLLESAARQIYLYKLLGFEPLPQYWHLPLVVGSDGRRLAKRHGDTRLSHYRDRGVSPQRLLGLIGYWSGAIERRRETDLDELVRRFDIARLPLQPVVFGPQDEKFLLG